jgi:hypothetical protein
MPGTHAVKAHCFLAISSCKRTRSLYFTASCKSLGSCSEKVVYTKHTRLLLFGIQLCASVTLL